MATRVLEPSLISFRNFNVCPHCEWNGEEALLSRLSEGIPMISRSDGSRKKIRRDGRLGLRDRSGEFSYFQPSAIAESGEFTSILNQRIG